MWGWKNVSHLPNILPSINMLFMERSSFDTWDVQDFSTHVLCEHSIDVALNRFPLDSLHRFYFRLGYVELSYRNDINFVPVSLIKCCNQHNQAGEKGNTISQTSQQAQYLRHDFQPLNHSISLINLNSWLINIINKKLSNSFWHYSSHIMLTINIHLE